MFLRPLVVIRDPQVERKRLHGAHLICCSLSPDVCCLFVSTPSTFDSSKLVKRILTSKSHAKSPWNPMVNPQFPMNFPRFSEPHVFPIHIRWRKRPPALRCRSISNLSTWDGSPWSRAGRRTSRRSAPDAGASGSQPAIAWQLGMEGPEISGHGSHG